MTVTVADGLLEAHVQSILDRCFGAELERAYEFVDRLCLELCLDLASELHLLTPTPEPLTHLQNRLGVAPDAVYFLDTVLAVLAEAGFAEQTSDGWQAATGGGPVAPLAGRELEREARAACPAATPTFDLISRCREHASAFLTGRISGAAAIFPHGDTELWQRVHRVDRIMSIYADVVAPILEVVGPRGARVLEIGAGTGAVLSRCLATLRSSAIEQYWFTDVGRTFVQDAQSIFAGVPWLRFTTLDIDRPLSSQDLPAQRFDIVIGVNVMHAAKRLGFSLSQVHDVLEPGGLLILGEGSPPGCDRRWRLDLVYGFLRGWWNVATHRDLRPSPGFLLASQWTRALRSCGFDEVHALPHHSWSDVPHRGGALVARKVNTASASRGARLHGV